MRKSLLILALTCLGAFAQAGSEHVGKGLDNHWGFGFGLGTETIFNSTFVNDNLSSDLSGGLWLRYHMSNAWSLELAGDYLSFREPRASMTIPTLSLNYRMWATQSVKLNIGVGAGAAFTKDIPLNPTSNDVNLAAFSETSYTELAIKGRLALEFMLSAHTMLSLNGDYFWVKSDDKPAGEFSLLNPSLALTFYWGGASTKKPEPVVKVIDSDNDGVPDNDDKCPMVAAGKDGLANGCPKPKDTDKDGVSDDMDKCPGTLAGKPVNSFGCASTQKFEISLDVKFDSGKSVVKETYSSELEKFSTFMKEHKKAKAEIEGHTDSTGSEKYNFTISQRRADAVRKYLVDKLGVEASRLTAKGFGPSQPVGDNKTREGRTQNRRVVANISVVK